jgi:hypothetical protein
MREHGCDLEIALHLDRISPPPSIWFNKKRLQQWCLDRFQPFGSKGAQGVHGWPFKTHIMYWAAATAAMANTREKASCLSAIMLRTYHGRQNRTLEMTRPRPLRSRREQLGMTLIMLSSKNERAPSRTRISGDRSARVSELPSDRALWSNHGIACHVLYPRFPADPGIGHLGGIHSYWSRRRIRCNLARKPCCHARLFRLSAKRRLRRNTRPSIF